MKWIQQFDLFFLDFDGLLVNTEELHYKAYCILCRRKGYDLPWTFQEYCFIAHTSHVLTNIYIIFPKLKEKEPDHEILYLEKKQIYKELLAQEKLTLMPGVHNFLLELSRCQVKRCVVTHSPNEQVFLIRNALPILDTLPIWITREQYDRPKPAPDSYLKALELLQDPGDRSIGFEDTLKGVLALKNAQISPVLICDKNHPQLKDSALLGIKHYVTFEEIPANLKFGQQLL